MKLSALVKTTSISSTVFMSALSLVFAIIMGFSALVRIPVPGSPVPVTLQTFALFAGCAILGRGYSLQMIFWYLILGFIGAPFFSGGSGFNYIFGATGGYLVGFVFAALIIGNFGNKSSRLSVSIMAYILAFASIYMFGTLQLKLVTGAEWTKVFEMGLYPFVLFDALKALAAWFIVRRSPIDLAR